LIVWRGKCLAASHKGLSSVERSGGGARESAVGERNCGRGTGVHIKHEDGRYVLGNQYDLRAVADHLHVERSEGALAEVERLRRKVCIVRLNGWWLAKELSRVRRLLDERVLGEAYRENINSRGSQRQDALGQTAEMIELQAGQWTDRERKSRGGDIQNVVRNIVCSAD